MGHSKVTLARDGQQAVDEVQAQGGAGAFDIILTDLQMPHKVPNSCCLVSSFLIHVRGCLKIPPCL